MKRARGKKQTQVEPTRARRWGAALVMVAGLSSLTGCSFFKGLTNPDVAWAMSEPTPMAVVIRRTELATGIADQVDRIMADMPVDEAAEKALALKLGDAEKRLDEAASAPVYGGQPLRVVPAEAWLPTLAAVCAEDGGNDTLVGMLDGEVEDQLAVVLAQAAEIAKLDAQIDEAETARDADGASESAVAAAETKIAKLEEKRDQLEESFAPKREALVTAVREAAGKAPAKAKQRMTPIVLNLLEAVEDARIAGEAAILRYPMALPGITTDLQQAATRFVADVIEEQTGHRPSMKGIAPDVSLEGTDVKLGLNGVPAEALGDLALDDLIAEVTERLERYAGRTFTLIADAEATADRLAFQTDLLEAWRDGLEAKAEGTEGVIDITDVEVMAKAEAAGPKKDAAKEAKSLGKRSLSGLTVTTCGTADAPKVATVDEPPKQQPAKAKPAPRAKGPAATASAKSQKPAKKESEWIDLPKAGGGDGPMLERP
ncbi:MAG: hypothetical protein KC731_16810 [Myxococcales bacterium]|nr:hypothetical protein [Myxococcales bacterium]